MTGEELAERVEKVTAQEAADYLDMLVETPEYPILDPGGKMDEGLLVINTRCLRDSRFFAMSYMYESFTDPMTYQHDAVWRMLDDDTLPYVCVCAWRGFGKTTMYTCKKVKDICFKSKRFICIVGKSHKYAESITENIKMEVMGNPRIRRVFGGIKAARYEGVDTSFSKSTWFACDPITGEPMTVIVPKGAGEQIRGMNIRILGKMQRPDDISIDDLEDDEEVLNEEIRKQIKEWFHGALEQCVGRERPNPETGRWNLYPNPLPPWRIFYQDTLKHEDALIAHLLSSTKWKSLTFPQAELVTIDGEKKYVSLVPELISDTQVEAEVAHAFDSGLMDTYSREKLCLPISPDNAAWTRDMFKYYHEAKEPLSGSNEVERFIVVDPARTANQNSAYTAMLAVAARAKDGKIFIRSLINERLEPHEIYDKLFKLAYEMNTKHIAVETTGLELHMKHTLKNEALQRGAQGISFIWLKAQSVPRSGDFGRGKDSIKRARASTMLPYYKKGQVYHEYGIKGSALERQMLTFPRSANWDALDCAGYIPQVLESMGRYFLPQVEESERPQFMDHESKEKWDELIKTGGFLWA